MKTSRLAVLGLLSIAFPLFLVVSPVKAIVEPQGAAVDVAGMGAGPMATSPNGVQNERVAATEPAGAMGADTDLAEANISAANAGISPSINATQARQANRTARVAARQANRTARVAARQASRAERVAARQASRAQRVAARRTGAADPGSIDAAISAAGGSAVGIVEASPVRGFGTAGAAEANAGAPEENPLGKDKAGVTGNMPLGQNQAGTFSAVSFLRAEDNPEKLEPGKFLVAEDKPFKNKEFRFENVLDKPKLDMEGFLDQGADEQKAQDKAGLEQGMVFEFKNMQGLPPDFRGQNVMGVPVVDQEELMLDSGKASLTKEGMLNMELHGLKMADGSIPSMELGAMVSCLDPVTGFSTFKSEGAFHVDASGNAIHQGSLDMQGSKCIAPQVFAATPDGKAFAIGNH